jgi:hypothetical protein
MAPTIGMSMTVAASKGKRVVRVIPLLEFDRELGPGAATGIVSRGGKVYGGFTS